MSNVTSILVRKLKKTIQSTHFGQVYSILSEKKNKKTEKLKNNNNNNLMIKIKLNVTMYNYTMKKLF